MGGGVPQGRSRTADLGGPVHWVDYGGPTREEAGALSRKAAGPAPTFVLVHGLGGSHLNWDLLAPHLNPHARVVALDLPGFGRSEPGDRRASVPANVEVLDRFLAEVVDGPATLVGNSMGGMISVFAAARAPERVRRLVLLDPAVPGPRRRPDPLIAATFAVYAVPGLGEQFMRLRRHRQTPLARALTLLRLCGVDPDRLPTEVIDRSVEMIEQREDVAGMDRAFLAAARSLLAVLAEPSRYRAAMGSIGAPVLLVQGDLDRLVPVDSARDVARRNPRWRYVELAGVGHVPQLQVPERVAAEILGWSADPQTAERGAGQPGRGANDSRSASSPV